MKLLVIASWYMYGPVNLIEDCDYRPRPTFSLTMDTNLSRNHNVSLKYISQTPNIREIFFGVKYM